MVVGRRFASPGFVCPPCPPVALVGWAGVSRSKSAAGGPSSESAGVWWVLAWVGGVGFGVVGSGVCSLLGRAPEAIRNLPGGQAAVACAGAGFDIRHLTSRQNPDRASPARPRREHTPSGPVWAAPGPGPVTPVMQNLSSPTVLKPPMHNLPALRLLILARDSVAGSHAEGEFLHRRSRWPAW